MSGKKLQIQIGVDSVAGQGSTFFFEKEFAVQSTTNDLEKGLPFDLRNKRVLLLDDNFTSLSIFENIFTKLSFQVHKVATARQLIAIRDKIESFDLVVYDLDKERIKKLLQIFEMRDRLHLNIPIIITHSLLDVNHVIEVLDGKSNFEMLRKPFTPSRLFDTVLSLLHGAEHKEVSIDSKKEELAIESKGKILLVDDVEINQEIVGELLAESGFDLSFCNNGFECVEKVFAQPRVEYDLVLMDLQMPGMDGYTTTTEIRKRLTKKELPIVALSADALLETKQKCLQVGMQDLITKPIDPSSLTQSVRKWMKPDNADEINNIKLTAKEKSDKECFFKLKGFDYKKSIKRFNNNEDLLIRMMLKFTETSSNLMNQIASCWHYEDYDLMQRELHNFKGISSNLGFDELTDIIEDISSKIKNNIFEQDILVKLTQHLNLLNNSIERCRRRRDENLNVKSVGIDDVLPELEAMLIARTPRAKKVVDEYHINDVDQRDLFKLKNYIANYEYSKALNLLPLKKVEL